MRASTYVTYDARQVPHFRFPLACDAQESISIPVRYSTYLHASATPTRFFYVARKDCSVAQKVQS